MFAGSFRNLGFRADGALYVWGLNNFGANHLAPYQLTYAGFMAVSVSHGGAHYLALMADGRFYAWGANGSGQLGTGNQSAQENPTLLGKLDLVAFSAGGSHSLGLKADGSLWAWGDNSKGQLGQGDTANRLSPTQVKSFNAPRAVVIPMN